MIIDETAAPTVRPPFWRSLYTLVLIAMVLGILLGWLAPDIGIQLKPLGDAFIKLVKMVIAPVIFLTVATGIAGLSHLGDLGRVALKTFGYFLVMSTFALIVGLIVANVVQPGAGMHIAVADLDTSQVVQYTEQAHDQTVVGFLTHIIPTTLVSALSEGEILQVLFVAILFGIALSLTGARAAPVLDLLERLTSVVFRMVGILMKAAPIGVFGA
ncbi:MAG: cation:dicarboxylase symporter family transporter, partial [Sphingomonadales bacterium]